MFDPQITYFWNFTRLVLSMAFNNKLGFHKHEGCKVGIQSQAWYSIPSLVFNLELGIQYQAGNSTLATKLKRNHSVYELQGSYCVLSLVFNANLIFNPNLVFYPKLGIPLASRLKYDI